MSSARAPVRPDSTAGCILGSLPLERLKKPVGELLMHTGETYRQIQEERELIDRTLPTQHDGKVSRQVLWEEGARTRGWLPQVAQLGEKKKKSAPSKGIVKPSRPLLNPIMGPVIGHWGPGELSYSACGAQQ